MNADIQGSRHFCIRLPVFTDADKDFAAPWWQAVERFHIAGKQLLAYHDCFRRVIRIRQDVGSQVGFLGLSVFLFQACQGGIAHGDEEIIFQIGNLLQ